MEPLIKLKSLFIDATALPAADRTAFLDSRCAGDPALREQVESLLAAHEQAGEYLAEPTLGPPTLQGLHGEGPGGSIGPYRLLEVIGEGGFGVVYMAEQREPVRRRVALKVIKAGMDTKQVIARFEAERQALAMMDHPNIAKVLDAGATEKGRPYFVMELVRGEPITAYADAQQLSIGERLALFQQVCQAVQHAHQKGIIHRDLKPSNILVARIDGRPTPRIIDFGIAKATGGAGVQLTEKTVFTEFRQFVGTPEYMSPEQAGMDAADIDTRSDIYSLGVLLYALLTGEPPFDGKRLRSAAWEEMRRIIREDQPPRPSTRLHSRQDTGELAARRHTEPERLVGLIRGDLDWIVMKCLEKERGRRYETANALALDIERHLSGEPVTAAPPSAAYRVRKFVRRHRVPVMAGALVAGVGLLGLVGTSVALVVARDQRDRAVEAEGRAQKSAKDEKEQRTQVEAQARLAEVRWRILLWSLGFANASGGEDLTMRQMLDQFAQNIETEYEGRPKDEVVARVALAQMFQCIDENLRAEVQARKAVRCMERDDDAFDPLLMFESRLVLSNAASAGASRAQILADRTLLADSAVGYLKGVNEELGDAAARFVDLALWQESKRPEDATRIALAGQEFLGATDSFQVLPAAQVRAMTRAIIVSYPESTPRVMAEKGGPIVAKWLERAQRLGLDQVEVLELRHTVLKLHVNAERCNGIEELAREQLRETNRLLPDSGNRMRWQRMRYDSCAAHALVQAGCLGEARPILVDVARRARDSDRLNNLAASIVMRHVLPVARTDPAVVEEALGRIDAGLLKVVWAQMTTANARGREWQVRELGDALAVQSAPDAGTRRLLASLYATLMPDLRALSPDGPFLLERVAEFVAGEPTAMYAQALIDLGKLRSEMGDWERALHSYESALKCSVGAFGDDMWFAAKARFYIGACESQLGRRDEGLSAMRENLTKVRDMLGPLAPTTIFLETDLYAHLLECGLRDEANETVRRLTAESRARPSPGLHCLMPLLRMAALRGDVDAKTLEGILEFIRSLTERGKWSIVGMTTPERVRNDLLVAELAILVKQGKGSDATKAACDKLGEILAATAPESRDVLAVAGAVARVGGLGAKAYELAEEACAKLSRDDRKMMEWHLDDLLSMLALRHDRLDEAIRFASAADAEWITATRRGQPDSAAVRACAYARQEKWKEARAHLEDARTWARDRGYATPLIAEAEKLIKGH